MEQTRWQQFNSIIDNEDLKAKEKLLLIAIFRYYNEEKGYSYPSKEKLKKKCSFANNRDYYKELKSLEDKGFITKETIKGIGCKFYINLDTHLQNDSECQNDTQCQNDTRCQNDTTTQCQNDTRGECQNDTTKRKRKENKKNIYIDLNFIDDVVGIEKVKLTQEQYDTLKDKYGESNLHNTIVSLNTYIANGKGSKYKNHYLTLNNWLRNNKSKDNIIPFNNREFKRTPVKKDNSDLRNEEDYL